ncbi:MAG: hypothetical protein DRP09_13265 [Candidatus Thorarchaeota archaeon]|nr:MAG: hypothetical protein DRP09_13265 [Candidatus Thorarchaeota archaeon]
MAYERDGKSYYRVTGVLSGLECEAVAWNIRNKTSTNLVANAVTLPGSLMHWKIEKFLSEVKGYEPPPPIEWGHGSEKIIKRWNDEGTIQERLVMPANEGFEGFLQFFRSFEYNDGERRHNGIDPIFIEKTMFVDDFMGTGMAVAGTVDLIARVRLKGKVEEDGLFHECKHIQPHDPLCDCKYHWVVTIMDWKYSIRKQASHPEQLSTYRYMAEVTGVLNDATEYGRYPLNHENWSVLFKKPNHGIGYELFKYQYNINPFLEALDILKNPRFTTLNHRNYTKNLKGRCMFCQYQNHCPDRAGFDSDGVVHVDS